MDEVRNIYGTKKVKSVKIDIRSDNIENSLLYATVAKDVE